MWVCCGLFRVDGESHAGFRQLWELGRLVGGGAGVGGRPVSVFVTMSWSLFVPLSLATITKPSRQNHKQANRKQTIVVSFLGGERATRRRPELLRQEGNS